MKIIGGSVFGPDHNMHRKDLCFEGGVITHSSTGGEYDASGCYVLPGLIDTHVHGAKGVEFYWSDKDITPSLDYLASQGVTSVLPGTCCQHPQELEKDIKKILALKDERILGIHAEGPFVNPVRKGGMFEDRIQKPDPDLVRRLQEVAAGGIKIMTLAPEMEGADQVIEACLEQGIKVSLGHTDATYECAKRAVDLGVSRMTHTFNAMRPYNHREPGVLGLALDDERVDCELICDLYHVSAPAMRMVIGLKGIEHVTAISDCSMFCGMGDGEYVVGGRTIYVKDGLCTLANGTICGSSKTLSDGVRNLFRLGYGPKEIAVMACVNPAKACGCMDRGELAPGYRADIVVFDENFDVKAVFLAGERIR